MVAKDFTNKNNETQAFEIIKKTQSVYELTVQDVDDSDTKGIAYIDKDAISIYNSEGKFIEEYSINVDIENTHQPQNAVFEKIAENTLISVYNNRLKEKVEQLNIIL